MLKLAYLSRSTEFLCTFSGKITPHNMDYETNAHRLFEAFTAVNMIETTASKVKMSHKVVISD